MAGNLKNYTTETSADVSIARIERLLVDAGAAGIAKEYKAGRVDALVFKFPLEHGRMVVIKLPANVAACQEFMWKQHCDTRSSRSRRTDKDFLPQAERTAWRIMQDWVEVQVSLIKLRQIAPLQAFLAYAFDGRKTVYERVQAGNLPALLPPE